MKSNLWKHKGGVVAAALAAFALSGCGSKTETASEVVNQPTTPVAVVGEDNDTASGNAFTVAAGTWGKIEMARAHLDRIVMSNAPQRIPAATASLRDWVEKLPSQSSALDDAARKNLRAHVTEVTQLTAMMDDAAKSKNSKSLHEHHAGLNEALDMIKGIYPADAFGSAMHMAGKTADGNGMAASSGSGAMSDDSMGAPMPGNPTPGSAMPGGSGASGAMGMDKMMGGKMSGGMQDDSMGGAMPGGGAMSGSKPAAPKSKPTPKPGGSSGSMSGGGSGSGGAMSGGMSDM